MNIFLNVFFLFVFIGQLSCSTDMRFMNDPEYKLSYCNSDLFTFEQTDSLKNLHSEIKITLDDIDDGNESLQLFAILLTKERNEYTIHRITNSDNFFDYIDKKGIQQSITKRVILFRECSDEFITNLADNSDKYLWLFDTIKDQSETPLLIECLDNQNRKNNLMYLNSFVDLMINKGATIDVVSKNGYAPLHFCALRNKIDIARLLLSKKIDVNQQSVCKYTQSS